MGRDTLHSTCRHCRQPVIFAYLPHMPEEDKSRPFRPRGMIWYHKQRELGKELHCQEGELMKVRAAPRDYCSEHVSGSSYSMGYLCNRPVKDHDLFMCGIHARQVHKEKERREKYRTERELSDYIFGQTLEIQKEIMERFGLETKPEYDWREHHYTGKVIVNPRQLLDLLDEAADEQEWEEFG